MNKNNKKNVTNAEYSIDKNGNLRLTKTGAALRTRRGMNLTPEEEEMVLAARRARMGQYVTKSNVAVENISKVLSGVDTTKNKWTPTDSDRSVERQTTTTGYNPSTATFASASNLRRKSEKLMNLAFLFKVLRASKVNFDGEAIKIELNATSFEDLIRELIKQGEL